MRVAVIPARGGSKRIPRKNIKVFNGKPMIAWSIEAAKLSEIFDHIIVSTDDHEIAEVASAFGAEVPFTRPPELADDYTGTAPVIAHAIKWAASQGITPEAVCCIYATAPFIQSADLRQGLDYLTSGDWEYTFTATHYSSPIFRSFAKNPDGGIEMFFPDKYFLRSQELPDALHDAGQFYWGRPTAWLESKPIFQPKSRAIVIPRWRVQDIDTPDDWTRAEMLASIIENALQVPYQEI